MPEPNWKLIDAAARSLTARGVTPFTRIQIFEEVWRRHPDRQRASLDPTFQGMIHNAPGGPASAGGTPLRRVDRGSYVLSGPGRQAAVTRDRAVAHVVAAPPEEDTRLVEVPVAFARTVPLHGLLRRLAEDRPVFHSEADFQHAFAWHLHAMDPSLHVRLETRPVPGMRLDLLVTSADRSSSTAIEFKYLTRRWTGRVHGEAFALKDQGAQDICGYDVVKDIWRLEQVTQARPAWDGILVCLSNDPYYWSSRTSSRATNADAFRLTDGSVLRGERAWGPSTGAGTLAGRAEALDLAHAYPLLWSRYSSVPGAHGDFRLLVVPVQHVPGLFQPAATASNAPPQSCWPAPA